MDHPMHVKDAVPLDSAAAAEEWHSLLHGRASGARCPSTDAKSLTTLRELYEAVATTAKRVLRDPDDIEDAIQLSLIKLWRESVGACSAKLTAPWAARVCANVCIDMLRQKHAWHEPYDDATFASEPAINGARELPRDPHEKCEASELRCRLLRAVRLLPKRQRIAVACRYLQELSVEETAKLMHCSAGTVKATVHAALKALRSLVGQEEW